MADLPPAVSGPVAAPLPLPASSAVGQEVTQRVTCAGSVTAASLTCGMPADGNAPVGSAGVLLGGQGTYVRLTSSHVSYWGGSIFEFRVTIQNLLSQVLGSTDGVTLDPNYIKLVLVESTVTGGTGYVDGSNHYQRGTYTAPNQPVWVFTSLLEPNATSSSQTLYLEVPSTVTTFTIKMLVSARIPVEQGILRWAAKNTGTGYDLMGVGCSSASNCAAVGLDGNIRQWNGTSWASYPSGIALALRGASCVSATFCVAVGDAGEIYHWNGGGWSEVTWGGNNLNAVSCVSTTFCKAVGGYPNNAVTIRSWNGSSWGYDLNQGSSQSLYGVSCPTTTFCMAVGPYAARRWDGSSWSSLDIGTGEFMRAVTCTSGTHCLAVGNSGTIRAWNGSSWSGQASGTSAMLVGVSCSSTTQCLAVGENGTLLEWTGSSWFAQPTGTSSVLYGASCLKPAAAPVQCVLTGSGGYARHGSR